MPANKHSRGVGLIEIMIALALGAIILLGVTEVATQNSITRNELQRFGRQIESATYALQVIESDVTNAAFWGERGEVAAGGTPPPVCVDATAELSEAMGYPIQGGRGDITCSPSDLEPKANTDYIALRRVSSCALGSPGCPGAGANFHLQVHACFDSASALKPGDSYKIDANTGNLDYENRDCSTLAPMYRFLNHIYFINDQDVLVRAELEGTQYVTKELVENVEMMRFEYGLDTNGDGQVNNIVSNLALPSDTRWAQVVMVRIGLVVRNHEPSGGYNDTRTYDVAGYPFTPGSKTDHRRQMYTRTVSTRNIGGRREDP